MCKTCLNKLASYLDFRNQCLEANRILNIAIFQGSDSLHNEESAYNVNFTEAETEFSDCEEDLSAYNQNTADLFKHLKPQSKQRQQSVDEITIPKSPQTINSKNKKVRLEIIDQLNSRLNHSETKSEIKIISDVILERPNNKVLKELHYDVEEIPQQENLTVGLELEIRSDNSPTRKQILEQTKSDSELFSIEPANINLNYDCEKDISVFTISENNQNNEINHDSDSGITTESSGCTIIQTEEPTNYVKRKSRHKCSYCGILTNDLTNHLLTHQDNSMRKRRISEYEMPERPFPCSMCIRTFATDSSLKCHFASHTREKNFICPVCSKSCAYKYTLSSHMRIHGIYQEIFSCDICEKTFRKK